MRRKHVGNGGTILIAVQLFVSEKGASQAAETGLQTMLEVLIQAQQAAMMAALPERQHPLQAAHDYVNIGTPINMLKNSIRSYIM